MYQESSLKQIDHLNLNDGSSQEIHRLMLEGKPYYFEHLYTENEIASVCMHLTDKEDCMLQALYLMQGEVKSKRLGYVLEVYWALSQSYLTLNQTQMIKYQVFSVESSDILVSLAADPVCPVLIELTDDFLEAVNDCKSWCLNGSPPSLSALGLMKQLLDYQLKHHRLVYFVFKDTLKQEGLEEIDYSLLLTPLLSLNLNLFHKGSIRRLATSSLRILNAFKTRRKESNKVFTLDLVEMQLAKEIKLSGHYRTSANTNTMRGYGTEELIDRIEEDPRLSGEIVAWTDEGVKNIYRLGIKKRRINRCVRLCVKKDTLVAARLLEAYQKHWEEGVYLSSLRFY